MSKLVKKSIFKQKTSRKIYVIHRENMGDMTHHDDKSGRWFADPLSLVLHKDGIEEIIGSEQIIYICDLEIPLLEIGELFYIEEKDITVKIKERIRSSNNSVCYEVEPKIIEDEVTKQSLEKCEKVIFDFEYTKKERDDAKRECAELREVLKQCNPTRWFK